MVLQSRETGQRPASYIVFDVLAVGGIDIRSRPWVRRRQRLDALAKDWSGSSQLCTVTFDRDEAAEWFEVLGAAMGIEGLVVKGRRTRYLPGHSSGWLKVRSVGVAVFDELTRGTCDQVSNGSRGA